MPIDNGVVNKVFDRLLALPRRKLIRKMKKFKTRHEWIQEIKQNYRKNKRKRMRCRRTIK